MDAGRELQGRVALVTGGSRGIGRAIVEELAGAGADVAFGFRADTQAAEALVARSEAFDVSLEAIRADLADADAPKLLVERTIARFGRIDILVVNAAAWDRAPLLENTPEMLDRMLRVNVHSSFFLVQEAARRMIDLQIAGKIVVVTSRSRFKPMPGMSAYALSKAAQYSLVRSAATELAPFDITVNEVAPGVIETELNLVLREDPDTLRGLLAASLVQRIGQPHEVANAVRFFVSDRAAFVTGATLSVDGGGSIT